MSMTSGISSSEKRPSLRIASLCFSVTGLYLVNSPLYTAPADSGGPGKGTDTTVAKGYSKAAKIKPPLLFNHAHTGVNDMQNVVIRQQLHAASSQNT